MAAAVEMPRDFKHAELAAAGSCVAIDPTGIAKWSRDKELARLLSKRQDAAFALPIGAIVCQDGARRAAAIRSFWEFTGLCGPALSRIVLYFDVPSAHMLKSPREVKAIMVALLGVDGAKAASAITWGP